MVLVRTHHNESLRRKDPEEYRSNTVLYCEKKAASLDLVKQSGQVRRIWTCEQTANCLYKYHATSASLFIQLVRPASPPQILEFGTTRSLNVFCRIVPQRKPEQAAPKPLLFSPSAVNFYQFIPIRLRDYRTRQLLMPCKRRHPTAHRSRAISDEDHGGALYCQLSLWGRSDSCVRRRPAFFRSDLLGGLVRWHPSRFVSVLCWATVASNPQLGRESASWLGVASCLEVNSRHLRGR